MNEHTKPVPRRSILAEDPSGRCDIAAVRMTELLVKRTIEPACGGLSLWDRGLGDLVEAYVTEVSGIPSQTLTLTDLARHAGLLPSKGRAG